MSTFPTPATLSTTVQAGQNREGGEIYTSYLGTVSYIKFARNYPD